MGLLSRLHEAGYNVGSVVIKEDKSFDVFFSKKTKSVKKTKHTPFFGEKQNLPNKGVLVVRTTNTQGQMDDFTVSKVGNTIKIKNSKGITQAKTWGTYKRIIQMIEI